MRAFPDVLNSVGLPVPERQIVEFLTQHVLLQSRDNDDQAAALGIDPLDPLPASLVSRLAQLHA